MLFANARIKSSSPLGPVILRPVSTNPTGSIRPTTGSTSIPAFVMTSITSREKAIPSASPPYDSTFIFRPEKCSANLDSSFPIFFRAASSKVRGWICCSSLRFSAFSSSVLRFSSPTSWPDAICRSAFLLRSWALTPRIDPLMWEISTPITSSPATPIAMSKTLATSTRNLAVEGLDGDWCVPTKSQMAHSSISSRHSCRMTHDSITTPSTTKLEKTHIHGSQRPDDVSKILILLSRADMALSSAEIELSKAEGSVGKLETAWTKAAEITIALLLVLIGYAAWFLIVTERDEIRYKKFIKRQHKA